MITELETGISDAASEDEKPRPSDLLEVTFQKDPNQKNKYLEAEPKILGVTEIALTVFFGSITATKENRFNLIMPVSLIGIIAGSLAIAAQKLHKPTLKACLVMQIVMCVIYANLFLMLSGVHFQSNSICWQYNHTHEDLLVDDPDKATCSSIMDGVAHLELLNELIATVQTALSATLAAYCCKVIQCCSPRSNVPVIAIKLPTAPE